MEQTPLFIETINDALREAVRSMGGSKKVGAALRPELLADAAGRWLADCLNGDRRERLHPEQVFWILREARKAGGHAAINWICRECGYSEPEPVEPETERDRLMREFIAATEQQKRIAERLESLQRVALRVA